MSKYIRILLVFSLLLTAIPCAVFVKNDKKQTSSYIKKTGFSLPEKVQIMNETDSSLSEIPLDDYLAGCVLAQMPCDFEEEALKCQAIIARTYVLYHRHHNKKLSENPQSYFTSEEAKGFYGKDYEKALKRATNAVKETEGLVLTHKNSPIVTAYHPISSGYTESAKDIWGADLPYLLSVESPHDYDSPQGIQTIEMTEAELFSRLFAFVEMDYDTKATLRIKNKTSHGTVLALEISSEDIKKEIAGKDFAEIYSLNSCNFIISFDNGMCEITCHGGGHLVGLSQWGANQMALSGKNCEEILSHYFCGVSLLKL